MERLARLEAELTAERERFEIYRAAQERHALGLQAEIERLSALEQSATWFVAQKLASVWRCLPRSVRRYGRSAVRTLQWAFAPHRMLPRTDAFRQSNHSDAPVQSRAANQPEVTPSHIGQVTRLPPEKDFSIAVPLDYEVPEAAHHPRIAVICHIFFPELGQEIASYLKNIPFGADLFISTDTEPKREDLRQTFGRWENGAVDIRITPNRGRDIAPKIVGFADVYGEYEYALHLHTKASSHASGLAAWRGYLLETLLGSPAIVQSIFEIFSREPELGFIAPQHFEPVRQWVGWGTNFDNSEALAHRLGFALSSNRALEFPSGSMFWARTAALRPLLNLGLSFASFPPETGQLDGTLAHAIERLYFAVGELGGFSWLKVARREFFHHRESIIGIRSPDELKRVILTRSVRLLGQDTVHPCTADETPLLPTPELLRVLNARRETTARTL